MGRHSRPDAGPEQTRRTSGRGALLAVLALVAVVVAVVVFLASRGDGDSVTADPGPGAANTSSDSSPAATAGSLTTGAAPAPSSVAPTTSAPPTSSAAPPSSAAPTTTPTASGTPTAAPKPPPLLSFTVTAASWISVTGPDGQIVGRIFPKGAKAAYDARELTVRTGNAGGVQFLVSGKKRRLGPSGQIEEFTVSKR